MSEITHKCGELPDNYTVERVAGKWIVSDGKNKSDARYCPFCGYYLGQLKSPAEKIDSWKQQENEKSSLPALTDRY